MTQPSQKKKLILLNASAVRISSCTRRLYLTIIDGYKQKINSRSIEFGSAFHKCPKVLEETNNIGHAMCSSLNYWKLATYKDESKKQYLDAAYLTKVTLDWCEDFHQQDSFTVLRDSNNRDMLEDGITLQYPKGKPLVELPFEIPFYVSDNIEVLLVGTIDKVVLHKTSNLLAVGDYKTTSSWDANEYLRSYILSGQLYFYTLALRKHIAMCNEASVLYPYKGQRIGSFIDGVFLKASRETEFKRSEVYIYTDMQLADYESCLVTLCKKIDEEIRLASENSNTTYIPLPDGLLNDSCSENKFGGKCNFFDYCACNDSIAASHVLRTQFVQEAYDPTNR